MKMKFPGNVNTGKTLIRRGVGKNTRSLSPKHTHVTTGAVLSSKPARTPFDARATRPHRARKP